MPVNWLCVPVNCRSRAPTEKRGSSSDPMLPSPVVCARATTSPALPLPHELKPALQPALKAPWKLECGKETVLQCGGLGRLLEVTVHLASRREDALDAFRRSRLPKETLRCFLGGSVDVPGCSAAGSGSVGTGVPAASQRR